MGWRQGVMEGTIRFICVQLLCREMNMLVFAWLAGLIYRRQQSAEVDHLSTSMSCANSSQATCLWWVRPISVSPLKFSSVLKIELIEIRPSSLQNRLRKVCFKLFQSVVSCVVVVKLELTDILVVVADLVDMLPPVTFALTWHNCRRLKLKFACMALLFVENSPCSSPGPPSHFRNVLVSFFSFFLSRLVTLFSRDLVWRHFLLCAVMFVGLFFFLIFPLLFV